MFPSFELHVSISFHTAAIAHQTSVYDLKERSNVTKTVLLLVSLFLTDLQVAEKPFDIVFRCIVADVADVSAERRRLRNA